MIRKVLLAAGAAMLLPAAAPLAAQDSVGVPPPAPAGWSAPKTEWGDPDLRGMYPLDQVGRTPMQRRPQHGDRLLMTEDEYREALSSAAEVEAGADREDASNQLGAGNWFEYGTALRQTALVVEPAATGRIPEMTAEGKRRQAFMKSSWNGQVFEGRQDFNPLDRCITRGMPASMVPFPYNNGVRIFQAPGWVVINHEMIHEQRFIPLDGRPQPASAYTTWLGSSRGHFEGDTLVVESTNFNGLAPMVIVGPSNGTSGIPTSTEMKIVERFTPSPDGLYYEAWVEDPTILTGKFKIGYPWRRDNAYEPFEYACHEGNTLLWANIRSTSPRYAEWREQNEREMAEVLEGDGDSGG
ncbi:MAG TPA: hypothetical protein VI168_14370 [Croceibacterium sp.]